MIFTTVGLLYMWKWKYQRKLRKLELKLNKFYYTRVVIDKTSMKLATNMLNSVNLALRRYFSIYHKSYPVGEFVLQGSVAEGLKVCEPNEFDVAIPIILPDDLFEVIKTFPGVGKLRYREKRYYHLNEWAWLDVHERHLFDDVEIQVVSYLSPRKVGEKIKEMILEAVNNDDFKSQLDPSITFVDQAKIHDYEFGPATEIKVGYKTNTGRQASFIVDYVANVYVEREEHVINPYYSKEKFVSAGYDGYYSTYFADPTVYWRVSNSAKERAILDYIGFKGKEPLLIYKALILLNKNLKNPVLGSYHVKNIVFLLAFQHDRNICLCCDKQYQREDEFLKDLNKTSFLSASLAVQIIEITKSMYQFLECGGMPWYFHQHDTMKFDLRDQKKAKLFNIPEIQASMRNYLKDIVESENWGKLIEDASDHASLHGCPLRKGVPYMKKNSTKIREVKLDTRKN